MLEKIKEIVKSLKNSNYAVVFTGAGISTESGIPDFRTPGKGLYSFIPEETFSLTVFKEEPEVFYKFAQKWFSEFLTVEPNFAHTAIAQLEKMGIVKAVITQNIDSLHIKAGSKNVYEIHGHFRTSHCLNCNKVYSLDYVKTNLIDKKIIPLRCELCNGLIKPDIIFFGEMLPEDFEKSIEEVKKSDLLLILGTSLKVYPAAFLPSFCKGEIIIINKEKTDFDERAKIVLNKNLVEVFKEIMKEF
jgi:NAD-dependent deacetylase